MFVPHLRRSFSRFARPVFKNIRNPYELILDTKPLVRQMKETNSRIGNLEQVSSPMSILKSFRLSQSLLSQLPTRQVKFHCFDTANHQYQARETILGQVHIDVEPVEIPVSGIPDVKKHFTIERGVLNIKQVQLKDNQIMLLNLPFTANAEAIRNHVKKVTSKHLSVNISYCLLGFPAQAVLTFVDKFEAEKLRDEFRARPMEDRDRKSVVKGFESNARELIRNRRLAINGIPEGETGMKLLSELSKYGRVVHLDFPHTVRRNAPKQQVYSLYKDSEQMIKIVEHFSQGQSQTQYYPPAESVELNSSRLQQFGKQMLGKLSVHNEQYYRRLQYAEEINLYPDSPLKVLHENKGYCLVLFSCSEEAQNCYFQLQNDYDIDLVSDYEFNYDKKFKQFIFRYIDNQAIQKQVVAAKNKFDHTYRDEFYQTNMIKDIFVKLLENRDLEQDQLKYDIDRVFLNIDPELGQTEQEDDPKKKRNFDFQDEDEVQEAKAQANAESQVVDDSPDVEVEDDGQIDLAEMASFDKKKKRKLLIKQGVNYYKNLEGDELRQLDPDNYKLQTTLLQQKHLRIHRRSKEYRADVAVQMMRQNDKESTVGRSFSELAQLELFGKMIKRDPVKPPTPHKKASDINFDYNPHHQAMIKMAQEVSQYQPQQISEINRARHLKFNQTTKELVYEEYERLMQEQNVTQHEQVPEDGNEPPRAQFSTVRHQATYRKLSTAERRQQLIAYHGMIKKLVNEYFGRFPADKINTKRKTYQLPTINRKELKFSFGDDFLTDDHLPHILNFHYDQEVALSVFTNYCKAQQAFKSLPIGQRESIMQAHKANQEAARLLLTDIGIVDEIFEAPEDARQVVRKMNLHQAQQGEQYCLIEKQGTKYIVKVVKNQPLIPLNTLSKLKKVAEQDKDQQQAKLEGQVRKTMQEKGYSMAEALSANGVSSEQIDRIAQMLVESAQIPMKVARVLMNAKSEHHKLLRQDAANQLALQKLRMEKQPLDTNNLIKDVSVNDVLLNSEANEFGTSAYKQL